VRPLDATRLAAQAIRRYPARSGMMLLAIAIGVALVIFAIYRRAAAAWLRALALAAMTPD